MDDDDRQRMALWRFGVLGPLVSARLEHGDRRVWFRAAAERVHEHPSGRLVQLSARTIEGWYRAYRRGGLAALRPSTRKDAGLSRAIRDDVADCRNPRSLRLASRESSRARSAEQRARRRQGRFATLAPQSGGLRPSLTLACARR